MHASTSETLAWHRLRGKPDLTPRSSALLPVSCNPEGDYPSWPAARCDQKRRRHTLKADTHSKKGTALRHTLQHVATRCNTLHHTATYCNTLQHTAIDMVRSKKASKHSQREGAAIQHQHKLQHYVATHCKSD